MAKVTSLSSFQNHVWMDNFTSITQLKKPFLLFLNTSFLCLISYYFISESLDQSSDSIPVSKNLVGITGTGNCTGVHSIAGFKLKCAYVRSNSACWGKGYINYLEIFYCGTGKLVGLGYLLLVSWLLVLFYVLGNTTAEYFCPSVENLSREMKLSPTIAGTTLLPFGNGANDVFSSIISFTKSSDGDVGFNSVLGGAFFISCFVVGIVSFSISSRQVKVDESSFIRDVLFLLFSLCCLLTIIAARRISFWFAMCFVSIYFLYIGVVSLMHFFYAKSETELSDSDSTRDEEIPLLGCVDEEKPQLPSQEDSPKNRDHGSKSRLFGYDSGSFFRCLKLFLYLLELPLYLPRRVTIPVVDEEKWSKPFAVCSAFLSPIFLANLWCTQRGSSNKINLAIYMAATLLGTILGNLTFAFTKSANPPKRFLFPWLLGGFLMSITWTYITAEELVSLLVTFANILGINPSILGLTVLAWGNSVGDLISNLAMAVKGGQDGAQIAMSGCYAGPLFNTLIGLGVSLVYATWSEYPSYYVIPSDNDLYETIGFLMAGLLWALVVLPKRKMQLDRALGGGLLAIYFCFLFLRLFKGIGLLKLGGSFYLNLKEVSIFSR